MRSFILGLVAGGFAVSAALAEPISPAQAKETLFAPSGMVFYPVDIAAKGFDAEASAKIKALQEGMGAQMPAFEAAGYGYYGALAVPVGKPLGPESLVSVAKLHSPGAAHVEVLRVCKAQSGAECAVVGLMIPAKYVARDLTLSAEATVAFAGSFGEGQGPRYLAYSPGSAAFSVVRGDGGERVALDNCNAASNGKMDCAIAIVEE